MGARAITDLDSVKSWAPSTQGVDDAVLERSLDAASALIEQFCGRRFTEADYVARHSGSLAYGDASDKLELADPKTGLLTPYVSVVKSLSESGTALATATTTAATIADGDYAIYGPRLAILKRATVDGNELAATAWDPGDGNVVIDYTAGYALEDMPAEIVQAVIELTWLLYREGSRSGMASRQASVGSASFSRELSPAAQSALEAHKMETARRTLAE